MNRKIRVIVPTNDVMLCNKFQAAFDFHDVEIYPMENPPEASSLDITIEQYEAWKTACVNETLAVASKTKMEGYDALVIGSGSDPAYMEAKEKFKDFPVIGLGWANMSFATDRAGPFSILLPGGTTFIESTKMMANRYGCLDQLISIETIEDYDPIFKGLKGPDFMNQLRQKTEACHSGGAKGIMLACPFMAEIADELNEFSIEKFNIPVFHPTRVAVEVAKTIQE